MQPNMHFLWTVCVLVSLIIRFNIYCTIILFFWWLKVICSWVVWYCREGSPHSGKCIYPERNFKAFQKQSHARPLHPILVSEKNENIMKQKILRSQALPAKKKQNENNLWTMHVKTYLRHQSYPLHKTSFSKFHEMGYAALSNLIIS